MIPALGVRANACFAAQLEKWERRNPGGSKQAEVKAMLMKDIDEIMEVNVDLKMWQAVLAELGDDEGLHEAHDQWLYRYGLGEGMEEKDSERVMFFSFCTGLWEDCSVYTHCWACNKCYNNEETWHCGVCKKCRSEDLHSPCVGCGGISIAHEKVGQDLLGEIAILEGLDREDGLLTASNSGVREVEV